MFWKDVGEMNGKQKTLMLLALLNRILFNMTNVYKLNWENQTRIKEDIEGFQHEPCFLSNRGSKRIMKKTRKPPPKWKQNRQNEIVIQTISILGVSNLHVSLLRGWHCSCQLLEECNHGLYLQRSEWQMCKTMELCKRLIWRS